MLNDQMLAEDTVQNVFLKFFENLNNIHKKQSIQFWLFKTTRNEILTFFRNRGNKKLYLNSVDVEEIEIKSSQSVPDEIENRELSKLIFNELNDMSEISREVFVLREYSGLSYKEIASTLEIDIDLVKSRLYKTRQNLADRISKYVK
jgi:RNA polymerase sigma-70 factor (ECF subfamily)